MTYNINDDIESALGATSSLDSSSLYQFLLKTFKNILTTDNEVKTALTTYLQTQLSTISQNLNTPTINQIETSIENKLNSNIKISNIESKVNLISNTDTNNAGIAQNITNILSKVNNVPALIEKIGTVSPQTLTGTGLDTLFGLIDMTRIQSLQTNQEYLTTSGPIQTKLTNIQNAIDNFQPVVNIEGITISASDVNLLTGAFNSSITAAKNTILENLLDVSDIETATSNVVTPALTDLYNTSLDPRFDSLDTEIGIVKDKSDSIITKSDLISSKIGNQPDSVTVLSLLSSNSNSLAQINNYCLGTWKIESSMLNIYDASGNEVLFSFDLKDENGDLNIFDIKQRVRK